MLSWDYFDRFEDVINAYMPVRGEGETLASQTVTAVNKLIYKWYNDGDVFDNTYALRGWCNDLSSYANWLAQHHSAAAYILEHIRFVEDDDDYANLLKELADTILVKDMLEFSDQYPKDGSIYDCEGEFRFEEHWDWDEDDWEEEE